MSRQGGDYTTGCLLEYNYIKNYYASIAVDLSRQQELDADPKVIQQLEFVDDYTTDAGNDQSMFILTILEKIKEARLNFSEGSVTVL